MLAVRHRARSNQAGWELSRHDNIAVIWPALTVTESSRSGIEVPQLHENDIS
jgi:hypothetical protein